MNWVNFSVSCNSFCVLNPVNTKAILKKLFCCFQCDPVFFVSNTGSYLSLNSKKKKEKILQFGQNFDFSMQFSTSETWVMWDFENSSDKHQNEQNIAIGIMQEPPILRVLDHFALWKQKCFLGLRYIWIAQRFPSSLISNARRAFCLLQYEVPLPCLIRICVFFKLIPSKKKVFEFCRYFSFMKEMENNFGALFQIGGFCKTNVTSDVKWDDHMQTNGEHLRQRWHLTTYVGLQKPAKFRGKCLLKLCCKIRVAACTESAFDDRENKITDT